MLSSVSATELAQHIAQPSEPNLKFQEQIATGAEQLEELVDNQQQVECANAVMGAAAITTRALEVLAAKDTCVIALGGPSRSGKGHVTALLKQQMQTNGIGVGDIPMDWFYLLPGHRTELSETTKKEVTVDDPESIWFERLLLTLQALQAKYAEILFPKYLYGAQNNVRQWHEHNEVAMPTTNKRVYIVDGIFAGHPGGGIPDIADIHVHMDADGATQAARRIEVERERNYSARDGADMFLGFVVQKRNEHIDPYKKLADIVVKNTMAAPELLQKVPTEPYVHWPMINETEENIDAVIATMRTQGFVVKGFADIVDVTTNIAGRHALDEARLRFENGLRGLGSATFTLSLHENSTQYKGRYDLYPQLERAHAYIQGLQLGFGHLALKVITRRRTTLVNGATILHIDQGVHAGEVTMADIQIENSSLVVQKDLEFKPGQIDIKHAMNGQCLRVKQAVTKIGIVA